MAHREQHNAAQPKLGTPEFRALQKEWYQRLKDDGFRDIEQVLDNGDVGDLLLGVSQGDLVRGRYRTDIEEYYRWAAQHTHTIADPMRQHVWRLHAEGMGRADIYRVLRDRYPGVTTRGVKAIIPEEEARMIARAAAEEDAAAVAPRSREEEIAEVFESEVNPPWRGDPHRRSKRRDRGDKTRGFWDESRATGLAARGKR